MRGVPYDVISPIRDETISFCLFLSLCLYVSLSRYAAADSWIFSIEAIHRCKRGTTRIGLSALLQEEGASLPSCIESDVGTVYYPGPYRTCYRSPLALGSQLKINPLCQYCTIQVLYCTARHMITPACIIRFHSSAAFAFVREPPAWGILRVLGGVTS